MRHFNEWFRKKYQFLILGTFYMKWMIKLQKDIFTHFLSHLLGILQLLCQANFHEFQMRQFISKTKLLLAKNFSTFSRPFISLCNLLHTVTQILSIRLKIVLNIIVNFINFWIPNLVKFWFWPTLKSENFNLIPSSNL